jgi:hypothetical protein
MKYDMHNGKKVIGHIDLFGDLNLEQFKGVCAIVDERIGTKLKYFLLSPRTDKHESAKPK